LAYETIKIINNFTRKINEASLNEFQLLTKKLRMIIPTSENKIKTGSATPVIEEDEEFSSSPESGITPVNLMNIFLETSFVKVDNTNRERTFFNSFC